MKKLIGIAFVFILVFAGCDLGAGGDDNNGVTISLNELSVKDSSIKSLYVSNIPVNDGSRAAGGSSIQTIAYINSNGENTPFFFVSPSGKNIILEVDSLKQLDEKRIEARFRSYYEIVVDGNAYTISEEITASNTNHLGFMSALIDMESGKVYDFTKWNLMLVTNNIAFATEYSYTLYKIDFNNLSSAIPLNNPEYFSINDVKPPMLFGDKIIGAASYSDYYVIDINNAFPITRIKNAQITSEMCSFVDNPYEVVFNLYDTGIILQDLNGDTWFFITGGKTPGLNQYVSRPYYDYPEKYFFGKISIDDSGQVSLTDYHTDDFSFTPIGNGIPFFMTSADSGKRDSIENPSYYTAKYFMFIYENGFFTLKRKAAGIQVDSTALAVPTNLTQQTSFIKDGYLYYFEASSIKRLRLVSGSSPETLYTDSRLITNSGNIMDLLTVSGDNLIFYQFADDNTTVNTYILATYQLDAEPKLLSNSTVDIKNIVELDF